MPRTLLAVTDVENDGVLLVGAAPDAANGNEVPNNGRQFIVVQNNDAAPHTCTIDSYPQGNPPDGLTVSNKIVTIAAGAKKIIGPFQPSIYSTEANRVNLDWDSSVGMLVQAFSFAANPG